MKQPTGDVMVVRLGGSSFALAVSAVREIVRLPPVTRVPGLPAFVAGLANVRGRVFASWTVSNVPQNAERVAIRPS